MKTLTFNYVDQKGNHSERTVMVLHSPADKYSGIDLSELDPHEAAKFVAKYEDLQSQFRDMQEDLLIEYDLKNRYRQFIEAKMTDVIEL